MKNLAIIVLCLTTVLTSAVFTEAQSLKTAKGYFCGLHETDGRHVWIRTRNAKSGYGIYGGSEPPVIYVGFKDEQRENLRNLPVGTEIIVDYVFKKPDWAAKATNVVRKLTLTGKFNKKTKSCGFSVEIGQ